MKKRILGAILVLCVLIHALIPASGLASGEVVCDSLSAVKAYLLKCVNRMDAEISFRYTSALDELFSDSDSISVLVENCGPVSWSVSNNITQRIITFKDICYRQGFVIARSCLSGDTGDLGSEERTVLDKALSIVENARQNCTDDWQQIRYFHDVLCSMVTYQNSTDEGFSIFDTAVGALQYNACECDGYADAFYLLCTLAGLNAGYQSGSAADASPDNSHLWNAVELDGRWHMIDVTWDDLNWADDSSILTYANFNFGTNMAGQHIWDSELSLYPVSYTDWDVYYYTCHRNDGGAYYETLADAAAYAAWQYSNGEKSCHVMVKGLYEDGAQLNDLMANRIRSSWRTWYTSMGDYTCFDILFDR